MELTEMFNDIRAYHVRLGYDLWRIEPASSAEAWRENGLALFMEVAELIESMPWKPWRSISDQKADRQNAVMEIVDCFFFLGAMLETLNISPEELEQVFKTKMAENLDRIRRGYNNKPEERR